jgi:hypothetical protein
VRAALRCRERVPRPGTCTGVTLPIVGSVAVPSLEVSCVCLCVFIYYGVYACVCIMHLCRTKADVIASRTQMLQVSWSADCGAQTITFTVSGVVTCGDALL